MGVIVSQRSPDGRVWKVRRVLFGLGVTKPPENARKEATAERRPQPRARSSPGLLDPYRAAVTSVPFLVVADSCALLALFVGYLTGTLPYVVAAILLVAFVATLPWLLQLAAWLLLIWAALFVVALVEYAPFGVVAAIVWLAQNASSEVWIGLAITFAGLGISVLWGPWTVEAVSELPEWKALRWRVRGLHPSERVVTDVCDALWRGDAESFQPRGGSSMPTIVGSPSSP